MFVHTYMYVANPRVMGDILFLIQCQAKTKAKDLAENGVEIELMPIGRSFDVSAFYQVRVKAHCMLV